MHRELDSKARTSTCEDIITERPIDAETKQAPKSFPRAATTPSVEYLMTSRESTAESAKRRERRPSLCLVKNPA